MSQYSIVVSGPLGTFDITSKTLSVQLNRSLGEASTTLDLNVKNLINVHVMDDVILTVDGVIRFKGTVKSQSNEKIGNIKLSKLSCVDNTDKLQRRIVAEVYENKTAKQIILDLTSKYANWVLTNNVQDIGSSIELIRFDYDTLSGAIQKIAELVGAYWNLDENNYLHFFLDNDGQSSINYDATTNIIVESFSLKITAMELSNRVWILGAKAAAASYVEQNWIGDDVTQVFSLAYEPNYPEVYEGGVLKTIEVEKGETSSKDFVYNKKEKALKRIAGPLTAGVSLRFKYRPTVQVIDYFEDPGSVATYGLYEKAIRDRKITDKTSARKRGRSALKNTKSIKRIVSFDTRAWQVSPGQLTSIYVPSFEFNSQCRINSISISFTPADIVASIEAEEVFS